MADLNQLERVVWSVAGGWASDDDVALLHADHVVSLRAIDRLIAETEDDLASVRSLSGDERDQVIADFAETLESLHSTAARLRPPAPRRSSARRTSPSTSRRRPSPSPWTRSCSRRRGPGRGRRVGRRSRRPPGDATTSSPRAWKRSADRRSAGSSTPASRFPTDSAPRPSRSRCRRRWGGWWRWAVPVRRRASGERPVARAASPSKASDWPHGGRSFRPCASVDAPPMVRPTPGALDPGAGRQRRRSTRSPRRCPAPSCRGAHEQCRGAPCDRARGDDGNRGDDRRHQRRAARPSGGATERELAVDLADTVVARMDGSPFPVRAALASDLSRRLDHWSRPRHRPDAAASRRATRRPGQRGCVARCRSSHRRTTAALTRIDAALRAERDGRVVTGEWQRLGRPCSPSVNRATLAAVARWRSARTRRGEFMTDGGPVLAAIGFDVRVPALSRTQGQAVAAAVRRGATASVVGAHQLSNVSVVGALRRRRAHRRRGDAAGHARPDRSCSRAAAGSRSTGSTSSRRPPPSPSASRSPQLTGAEILRHSIGLDGCGLAGGVGGRRQQLGPRHRPAGRRDVDVAPDTGPPGFVGDAALLPGRGAGVDRVPRRGRARRMPRPRHGPGQDADRARPPRRRRERHGKALVVAPAAVVGNWAAEAARFTPGLRVVVHHGASRPSAERARHGESPTPTSSITTYATAVRDIDALAAIAWHSLVLDEAQAIKNPASDTAQQLRRIAAHTKLALTGTPIENSLGDLWAILDFTNPGSRRDAARRSSPGMSGDDETRAAGAERDPAVPAHQGRARGRRRAAGQDRRARPLHDDPRADRALPGRARRTRARRGRRRAGGEPKKGAILAAITALKQICNHPAAYRDDGRPLAGRSGQADPARGARRVGVRGRGADLDVHPLRHLGAADWPTTSPRSPGPRSPATTAASAAPPATAWSTSSRTAPDRARSCCR